MAHGDFELIAKEARSHQQKMLMEDSSEEDEEDLDDADSGASLSVLTATTEGTGALALREPTDSSGVSAPEEPERSGVAGYLLLPMVEQVVTEIGQQWLEIIWANWFASQPDPPESLTALKATLSDANIPLEVKLHSLKNILENPAIEFDQAEMILDSVMALILVLEAKKDLLNGGQSLQKVHNLFETLDKLCSTRAMSELMVPEQIAAWRSQIQELRQGMAWMIRLSSIPRNDAKAFFYTLFKEGFLPDWAKDLINQGEALYEEMTSFIENKRAQLAQLPEQLEWLQGYITSFDIAEGNAAKMRVLFTMMQDKVVMGQVQPIVEQKAPELASAFKMWHLFSDELQDVDSSEGRLVTLLETSLRLTRPEFREKLNLVQQEDDTQLSVAVHGMLSQAGEYLQPDAATTKMVNGMVLVLKGKMAWIQFAREELGALNVWQLAKETVNQTVVVPLKAIYTLIKVGLGLGSTFFGALADTPWSEIPTKALGALLEGLKNPNAEFLAATKGLPLVGPAIEASIQELSHILKADNWLEALAKRAREYVRDNPLTIVVEKLIKIGVVWQVWQACKYQDDADKRRIAITQAQGKLQSVLNVFPEARFQGMFDMLGWLPVLRGVLEVSGDLPPMTEAENRLAWGEQLMKQLSAPEAAKHPGKVKMLKADLMAKMGPLAGGMSVALGTGLQRAIAGEKGSASENTAPAQAQEALPLQDVLLDSDEERGLYQPLPRMDVGPVKDSSKVAAAPAIIPAPAPSKSRLSSFFSSGLGRITQVGSAAYGAVKEGPKHVPQLLAQTQRLGSQALAQGTQMASAGLAQGRQAGSKALAQGRQMGSQAYNTMGLTAAALRGGSAAASAGSVTGLSPLEGFTDIDLASGNAVEDGKFVLVEEGDAIAEGGGLSRNAKIALGVGIGGVAVAAIGTGIYFATRKKDQPQAEADEGDGVALTAEEAQEAIAKAEAELAAIRKKKAIAKGVTIGSGVVSALLLGGGAVIRGAKLYESYRQGKLPTEEILPLEGEGERQSLLAAENASPESTAEKEGKASFSLSEVPDDQSAMQIYAPLSAPIAQEEKSTVQQVWQKAKDNEKVFWIAGVGMLVPTGVAAWKWRDYLLQEQGVLNKIRSLQVDGLMREVWKSANRLLELEGEIGDALIFGETSEFIEAKQQYAESVEKLNSFTAGEQEPGTKKTEGALKVLTSIMKRSGGLPSVKSARGPINFSLTTNRGEGQSSAAGTSVAITTIAPQPIPEVPAANIPKTQVTYGDLDRANKERKRTFDEWQDFKNKNEPTINNTATPPTTKLELQTESNRLLLAHSTAQIEAARLAPLAVWSVPSHADKWIEEQVTPADRASWNGGTPVQVAFESVSSGAGWSETYTLREAVTPGFLLWCLSNVDEKRRPYLRSRVAWPASTPADLRTVFTEGIPENYADVSEWLGGLSLDEAKIVGGYIKKQFVASISEAKETLRVISHPALGVGDWIDYWIKGVGKKFNLEIDPARKINVNYGKTRGVIDRGGATIKDNRPLGPTHNRLFSIRDIVTYRHIAAIAEEKKGDLLRIDWDASFSQELRNELMGGGIEKAHEDALDKLLGDSKAQLAGGRFYEMQARMVAQRYLDDKNSRLTGEMRSRVQAFVKGERPGMAAYLGSTPIPGMFLIDSAKSGSNYKGILFSIADADRYFMSIDASVMKNGVSLDNQPWIRKHLPLQQQDTPFMGRHEFSNGLYHNREFNNLNFKPVSSGKTLGDVLFSNFRGLIQSDMDAVTKNRWELFADNCVRIGSIVGLVLSFAMLAPAMLGAPGMVAAGLAVTFVTAIVPNLLKAAAADDTATRNEALIAAFTALAMEGVGYAIGKGAGKLCDVFKKINLQRAQTQINQDAVRKLLAERLRTVVDEALSSAALRPTRRAPKNVLSEMEDWLDDVATGTGFASDAAPSHSVRPELRDLENLTDEFIFSSPFDDVLKQQYAISSRAKKTETILHGLINMPEPATEVAAKTSLGAELFGILGESPESPPSAPHPQPQKGPEHNPTRIVLSSDDRWRYQEYWRNREVFALLENVQHPISLRINAEISGVKKTVQFGQFSKEKRSKKWLVRLSSGLRDQILGPFPTVADAGSVSAVKNDIDNIIGSTSGNITYEVKEEGISDEFMKGNIIAAPLVQQGNAADSQPPVPIDRKPGKDLSPWTAATVFYSFKLGDAKATQDFNENLVARVSAHQNKGNKLDEDRFISVPPEYFAKKDWLFYVAKEVNKTMKNVRIGECKRNRSSANAADGPITLTHGTDSYPMFGTRRSGAETHSRPMLRLYPRWEKLKELGFDAGGDGRSLTIRLENNRREKRTIQVSIPDFRSDDAGYAAAEYIEKFYPDLRIGKIAADNSITRQRSLSDCFLYGSREQGYKAG